MRKAGRKGNRPHLDALHDATGTIQTPVDASRARASTALSGSGPWGARRARGARADSATPRPFSRFGVRVGEWVGMAKASPLGEPARFDATYKRRVKEMRRILGSTGRQGQDSVSVNWDKRWHNAFATCVPRGGDGASFTFPACTSIPGRCADNEG